MFRPIPSVLLKDSAVLKIQTGLDDWQNPTFREIKIKKVHLQNTTSVTKSKDNTEILSTSILFIDCKISRPKLDYEALQNESEKNGGHMRVVVYNANGVMIGDYAVISVDQGLDVPAIRYHHTELGLI